MKIDELRLYKREIQAEICKRDFFEFVKYMHPVKVTWNWHHKYVASILQKFQEGYYKRLMIFLPPQHQKTTFMTEYLPAWTFGMNPNEQIILSMYDSPQAEKYNRKIQRIISDKKYINIFPKTKLNEKNIVTDRRGSYVRNSREFEIVDYIGFFKSVGIGAGIAGNPAKMALIDDIIKNVEEAHSVTYRNKTYDWYTDELETRLHNDSRVAFTITRRHEDDLAGRLLERDGLIGNGGKWKVIILPAIKEDNNNPKDPREIGDALFPELHSLERLLEIKEKNPRTFNSLYQQRPAPQEGNMIKKEWFKTINFNELPFNIENEIVDIWIDGAYTKDTKNDPTAIMACIKHNENTYILNSVQKWLELYELLEYIPNFAESNYHNNRGTIYIEPKASGKGIVSMINKIGYNAVEIKNDVVAYGKMTRASNSEPTIQSGKIYLVKGNWNDQFIDECCTFPNAKHDDQLDNLTYSIHKYYLGRGKIRLKTANFYNS